MFPLGYCHGEWSDTVRIVAQNGRPASWYGEIRYRLGKQIFIRHSPGAAEARRREIFFFDESVKAVSEKECAHLIEDPLAAVKKYASHSRAL